MKFVIAAMAFLLSLAAKTSAAGIRTYTDQSTNEHFYILEYRFTEKFNYLENFEGRLKDEDLPDGKYIGFYYNKMAYICYKGAIKNGTFDGEQDWFYYSGNLHITEQYANSRHNGVITQYRDSSVVLKKEAAFYKNDTMQGADTCWYASGVIASIGSYDKNMKRGDWKYYYENGKLKIACTCISDPKNEDAFSNTKYTGVYTEWYPNGQKKKEGSYNRQEKDTIWWGNAQYPTGVWKEYYPDGTLKKTTSYRHYLKDGVETVNDSTGKIVSNISYHMGVKTDSAKRSPVNIPYGIFRMKTDNPVMDGSELLWTPDSAEIASYNCYYAERICYTTRFENDTLVLTPLCRDGYLYASPGGRTILYRDEVYDPEVFTLSYRNQALYLEAKPNSSARTLRWINQQHPRWEREKKGKQD